MTLYGGVTTIWPVRVLKVGLAEATYLMLPLPLPLVPSEIVSHGVPSQPGNMTLVAYLGQIPVLGVPGAAIALPTTLFDVLLPQIYAGVRFTGEELTALGNGGLCQLCGACHFPNCTFGRY